MTYALSAADMANALTLLIPIVVLLCIVQLFLSKSKNNKFGYFLPALTFVVGMGFTVLIILVTTLTMNTPLYIYFILLHLIVPQTPTALLLYIHYYVKKTNLSDDSTTENTAQTNTN